MVEQKEFLNKLKDFGLNSYEAKLWTALLSRGISTAGELSDIANVPRSRSYDVLESLERKGFVVMKLGKPIKYLAVNPDEALDRVKKRVHEDAERQAVMLDSLRNSDTLGELNSLHKQGLQMVEPSELAGVVRGRENLYHHIASMLKHAEKSITILTTEHGFTRKAEHLRSLLDKARSRGVSVRIAAPVTKQNAAAAKALASSASIRHIADAPARFVVVDGKQVALMPLDDKELHPSTDFGVWLSVEPFAKSFDKLFSSLWDSHGKEL
jgi:sugar-specific transcriptional regulator TrmB